MVKFNHFNGVSFVFEILYQLLVFQPHWDPLVFRVGGIEKPIFVTFQPQDQRKNPLSSINLNNFTTIGIHKSLNPYAMKPNLLCSHIYVYVYMCM